MAVVMLLAAVAAMVGGAVRVWDGPSSYGLAAGDPAAGPGDGSGSPPNVPTPEGLVYVGEYRNNLYDPPTGMSLFWQNDAKYLYVGLISPGTGWLGVGFGHRAGKAGSNIILGAVADGMVTIQDGYGVTRVLHLPDRTSSIVAFGGSEDAGQTTLEFVIPLAGGDPQDVALVPGETVQVILAYQESRDDLTAEHTRYSRVEIFLDP